MSSEEIKTIYKKLVQSYAEDYPRGNPLWVLNKHIQAYVNYQWKAKEPAILDLALRKGIEIPKVKELIEKGRTRKEAILEVSKNMKFQVSETEVEKWLKRLREPPRKVKETAEQKMEQQIKEYEKSIERLTTLFSKGEIGEEAYKIAIKKIEKDINELRTGKEVSVTEEKKEAVVKPKASLPLRSYTGPTKLWYLVPFFFGIIGGLIGYVAVKDEDAEMATNLLTFGIFMFFVNIFVGWWLFFRWLF